MLRKKRLYYLPKLPLSRNVSKKKLLRLRLKPRESVNKQSKSVFAKKLSRRRKLSSKNAKIALPNSSNS